MTDQLAHPDDAAESVDVADSVEPAESAPAAFPDADGAFGSVADGTSNGAAPAKKAAKKPAKRKRRNAGGGKRTKEAFWVRIAMPDGTSQFFPATEHIGKAMPFANPKETCAMRVYPEVVCFSLLHLTKRATKDLRDKPIEMPHAPLSRLARRAEELGAAPGTVVVEHRREVNGEQVDHAVTMELKIDAAKVATLDCDDDTAHEAFELGRRGERISLFMVSPTSGRRVALGYIGHLGRPESPDTMLRCASKILNAASALPEFSLLTGIEAADVPGMPGGVTIVRPATTAAATDIDVRFFGEPVDGQAPALVAEGNVHLEIDLEHASGSTDRLLFHLTPDESLEAAWQYYQTVVERWVGSRLAEELGDELSMVVYDIVLGEVNDDTVERLNEHLSNLGAVDFTPNQFRAR